MNDLEQRLIVKLERASKDGSPVAGFSAQRWTEMAAIARRRWLSFNRRHQHKAATRENRVEDLARCLCERFEPGGIKLAGALISDYRWLAEKLADVFESVSTISNEDESQGPSAKNG